VQIVYILACDCPTEYVWWLAASARALRQVEPESRIMLLTDEVSRTHLEQCAGRALESVDEVRVAENPFLASQTALHRSRFLKSNMRSLLEGPFLFCDCDTLCFSPPGAIANAKVDVVAAPDSHRYGEFSKLPAWIRDEVTAMGWREPKGAYLNSGVIWWNDTPKAKELGTTWASYWRELFEKRGFYKDQASFNAAIEASNPRVDIATNQWNALIGFDPRFGRRAKIMHYFGNPQQLHRSLLGRLAAGLRDHGEFDGALFEKFRKRCDPWAGEPAGFSQAWATWRLGAALRFAIKGLSSGKPIPPTFRSTKDQ